jgi:hypothetical protein
VSSLRYLGITFIGAAAGSRRSASAHACIQQRAALRGVAGGVHLRPLSSMVHSVFSHGAEVRALQLVTAAVAGSICDGMCGSLNAAETLLLGYFRCLLKVQWATPNGVALLKTGEQPLWLRWLQRANRL